MEIMQTDFRVEFGGDSHEIDLNTLLVSLMNFSSVMQEIQVAIAPETQMNIKVRPPQNGSFLIDMLITAPDAVAKVASLITRDNISLVDNVLSGFVNMIDLKKHLMGERPKSVKASNEANQVIVENSDGNTIHIDQRVINIYQQVPSIDKSLTKAFEAVESDPAIESVRISDNDGRPLTRVNNDEFKWMSVANGSTEPVTKREKILEGVHIRAIKLAFEDGSKWGFVFEGNKISANISDPSFWDRVDKNEAFSKGDTFKVNLKVIQRYDQTINEYLNDTYEVVNVIDHIPPGKQQRITL
jgi:hypothetical protein